MTDCKRIALFLRGLHNGGIEKVFELYYTHMDLEDYDIHIVTHMKNSPERKAVFEAMGCTVHEFSDFHWHRLTRKNFREYREFFQDNDYLIIHNNMPENVLPFLFAKKRKSPIRVLHAHSNYNQYVKKKTLFLMMARVIYKTGFHFNVRRATTLIGISEKAALAAFGKKRNGEFVILPNAIEVEKYTFNEEIRKTMRASLGIGDSLCIGHVGRYESDVKNQGFIIDMFAELKKARPNAKLLLIGEGPRKAMHQARVHELKMDDSVIFTGAVSNVCDYLQAMDVFVLPSLVEGLGISAIEAQASGLKCFLSDRVPHEAMATENVELLSIDEGIDEWVDKIASMKSYVRQDMSQAIRKAGYDINDQAAKLTAIYEGKELVQ